MYMYLVEMKDIEMYYYIILAIQTEFWLYTGKKYWQHDNDTSQYYLWHMQT